MKKIIAPKEFLDENPHLLRQDLEGQQFFIYNGDWKLEWKENNTLVVAKNTLGSYIEIYFISLGYIGLLLFIILNSSAASAKELSLFKAEELSVNYVLLDKKNRDPYVPQYTGQWKERAQLDWKVSVLDRLYWDNSIHTETARTSGQVKTVGWKWEVGLRLWGKLEPIELYSLHHSRHVVEEKPEDRFPGSDFPVEDGYGVRVRFIK